ncbi:MAG: PKD domain-containing protein [Saprospiraceae bacterium]
MSKNYNLKQKTILNSDQTIEQLSELQMTHKHNRRKNEILNGFVFMIGIAGFIVVFMLPRDGVFNNGNLEKSFSNSSPLASSSFIVTQNIEEAAAIEITSENPINISGFQEAGEVLEFELKSYKSDSKVEYVIHFGNGDIRTISDKITYYKYPNAGNFEVKVTAKYQKDTKQIFSEKVAIDDAIVVNSEAFVEVN